MNTSPISAAILSSWLLMSSAHSATTTLVIDSFLDPAGLDLSTTTGEVSEETVLLSEGTEIVGATRRIDFTVNTNPFFNDAVVEVGPREAGSILIFDTGPGELFSGDDLGRVSQFWGGFGSSFCGSVDRGYDYFGGWCW